MASSNRVNKTPPAAPPGAKEYEWGHHDVDIVRHGTKITLPNEPAPMPTAVAIEALQRKLSDEMTIMDVSETIEAFPQEAVVAFVQAMRETYGWASPVPTPGFWGPIPPDMITVKTGVDTEIQVPWGSFKLPGIERPVQTSVTRVRGVLCLRVTGQVRQAEREVLVKLARRTRELLAERSIYRGKAIRVETNPSGELDFNNPPTFMDTGRVAPEELILNREVAAQIDVNIFTPIRHTASVRATKIPLKRGVLLHGRFGVGKTLTTSVTAQLCEQHGWTFIMVDRPKSLTEALKFAQRYQPCVVYCEDIDRAMAERDDQANDILNTIDGILSKHADIMVVLTTNNVNSIHAAMLRPGRLDAVIHVAPPDKESVGRLISLYARGQLRPNESLDRVGELLAGNIPAVIREVTERSKLAMIARNDTQITEDDLLVMAQGMREHLALLDERPATPSVEETLGSAFVKAVQKVLGADLSGDAETSANLAQLTHLVKRFREEANDGLEKTITLSKSVNGLANRAVEVAEDIRANI